MLVTINTDASFWIRQKKGSYAFWAVSDKFRVKKSGVFKEDCINPSDAEARCIVNALHCVLLSYTGIKRVVINTDSMDAMALLQKNYSKVRKYLGEDLSRWKHIEDAYDQIMSKSKNDIKIEFRHVKAHSNIDDKRSFVNKWCDSQAKKILKETYGKKATQKSRHTYDSHR